MSMNQQHCNTTKSKYRNILYIQHRIDMMTMMTMMTMIMQ